MASIATSSHLSEPGGMDRLGELDVASRDVLIEVWLESGWTPRSHG
jgi:hypothetical protein